uniref:Uncharacterized protein n=1 Tax=Arundo donax TaxID=35708 RepID=A0A0A9DHB2_ARUDO
MSLSFNTNIPSSRHQSKKSAPTTTRGSSLCSRARRTMSGVSRNRESTRRRRSCRSSRRSSRHGRRAGCGSIQELWNWRATSMMTSAHRSCRTGTSISTKGKISTMAANTCTPMTMCIGEEARRAARRSPGAVRSL